MPACLSFWILFKSNLDPCISLRCPFSIPPALVLLLTTQASWVISKTAPLIFQPLPYPHENVWSLNANISKKAIRLKKIHTKVLVTNITITLMRVFDFVQRDDLHPNYSMCSGYLGHVAAKR